jgi:hypothetical protein
MDNDFIEATNFRGRAQNPADLLHRCNYYLCALLVEEIRGGAAPD